MYVYIYIYTSNLENPRFTERTSTNLGRCFCGGSYDIVHKEREREREKKKGNPFKNADVLHQKTSCPSNQCHHAHRTASAPGCEPLSGRAS